MNIIKKRLRSRIVIITKYKTIHLNYINGNKKQMVEEMNNIDISDFLEWLNEETTDDRVMALIISYFKIKEYYDL